MAATNITAESTTRFVQTKKWRLHYNEAGNGHAVIMLHGTGPGATGWSNFSPNIGPLSKHFRVILLDFPGWGESDSHNALEEPRNPSNALAVKLLMDELGIEKAALVGNSMGGAATLQFAVDFPDRLSHLITMGAGGGGPLIFSPGGAPPEGLKIIRETYENPTPENFRRLVSVMVYDSSFVTDELCAQRARNALANPEHLMNWLAPLRAGVTPVAQLCDVYDVLTRLASVKVPALLVHGRDDRTVLMENSLRLNSILQNSRLLILGRCGHWVQLEHANEFNALVRNFITMNS
jgi:2-hydroxy-6-oxonona-2,4-dienedioate hydrolase